MPCIALQIDPTSGPVIELGVSAAASLIPQGSARPPIRWIRAIVDTGCSHTSIHTSIAAACGLKEISKATTNTPGGPVACNIYHGDLFIKVPIGATGQVFEFPFKDRGLVQLVNPIPNADALFGMDILSTGTFHLNGITKSAIFCW